MSLKLCHMLITPIYKRFKEIFGWDGVQHSNERQVFILPVALRLYSVNIEYIYKAMIFIYIYHRIILFSVMVDSLHCWSLNAHETHPSVSR